MFNFKGARKMKKNKFDEFINLYDGETKGKYAYYYKYLWNACHYAQEDAYHRANWIMRFCEYLKDNQVPNELQMSVVNQLNTWLED